MPTLFKSFLVNLSNFQQISFGQLSKQLSIQEIEAELLNENITQDNNLTLGPRGFGYYAEHWVVSALVYGPVLGDIFNFVRMMNSIYLNVPIYRQKVVLLPHPPFKPPKIQEDGQIDLGKASQKLQQFCIKIRGLELVNLSYDSILDSVVDCQTEDNEGYLQVFDLYAIPIVIDSWQTGAYDEALEKNFGAVEALQVSKHYLPVPVKCGGFIRPVALLPNKTGISSEELLKRGAFLTIKDM